jgi:hypothetical protein
MVSCLASRLATMMQPELSCSYAWRRVAGATHNPSLEQLAWLGANLAGNTPRTPSPLKLDCRGACGDVAGHQHKQR